jgi:signal transduction histidine kinase
MVKASRKAEPKYSPKLLYTIQLAGLLVSFLIAAYSAFIYFSDAKSPSPFYTDDAMWLSTALFLILAIGQATYKPHTKRALTIDMILNYILTALYAVCVVGDAPAVYLFGIVLIVATEVILGFRAMIIGTAYFVCVMITFGAMYPDSTGETLVSIIISTVMMAGIAAVSIWLKSSNLVRIELYESLKSREELQAKRLETVINSLNDATLGVDSEGVVQLYNAAALSLLDTNTDISNAKIDDLLKLVDENGTPVSLAKLAQDTDRTVERSDLVHTYANGQKINLYLSISPIRGTFKNAGNYSMKGVIIIARDITKQKSLDDERDEFISVVSHELRTPVAIAEGALSNVQFLIEKGGDVKSLEKTLGDAHQQILFLSQMVNDLSTLSRAQRGVNMEPEDIDIEDFLHELHDKYLASAKKQHLKLELDSHAHGIVHIPRMAIEEVMQNFITNAIKYTNEGGVTIGARRVKGDNGPEVEFSVRDTGIGIGKSDQAHVFQKFWRSEDYRTRETSGTGLGLHVVKQLADKMNTQIEIRSRLNHGSTFSFRLPLFLQSAAKNQIADKGDDQIVQIESHQDTSTTDD